MSIQVFTDGSAKRNGKKDSLAGVGVYFSDFDPRNVSKSLRNSFIDNNLDLNGLKNTNNQAELMAILEALKITEEHLKAGKKLQIVTDSQYSISSLTKWYKNWLKNDWKNSSKKEILNKEIIEYIVLKFILKYGDNITFLHCNSHTKLDEKWPPEKKRIWNGNFYADFFASNFV
jgi:ribonuclease HI